MTGDYMSKGLQGFKFKKFQNKIMGFDENMNSDKNEEHPNALIRIKAGHSKKGYPRYKQRTTGPI